MIDCRLKEHRRELFDGLYAMNLEHRVMPGLVYLYMPELARRYGWDAEQRLWFAFLNGMTQNPITSLVIMEQIPVFTWKKIEPFCAWFDENWESLQFDTDRRYQKKQTYEAILGYRHMAIDFGSQEELLTGSYKEIWERAQKIPSFGRLACFSYLEYVKIMGFGADCDDLMFGDLHGSRSHRNGMLMLLGSDHLVMDKRAGTGVTGYKNLPLLAESLSLAAQTYLDNFRRDHPHLTDVSNFTFESNLCTFKNHFYGRRYPGVYADMAWERIEWADAHGHQQHTQIFKEIREEHLPDWLRCEVIRDGMTIKQRGAVFPETGVPYRAEHFL